MSKEKFTEEDIDNCWEYHKAYLIYILNGEWTIEYAREGLRSLIGSKYDNRKKLNGGQNE